MSEIVDVAYKFGCGRYRQEKNLISVAGEEIVRYGTKAFIVGGKTALNIVKEKLCESLKKSKIDFYMCTYSGHCSYAGAEKLAEVYKQNSCDMVIGVGGGKIMDFAKLLACKLDCPVVNIPTSSATCAAFTTLSVLYNDDGKTVGNFYQRLEVNCVLVDLDIMIHQPKRLLVSGYLDAIAKYIEMKNGNKTIDVESLSMDVFTASVLAKHVYDHLNSLLPSVLDALDKKEITEDFEKFIYLVIPVTGIISGISKGFGQSAIGHEFYYCMRTLFTEQTLKFLHGEIVGIGLIAQLYYNQLATYVPELETVMTENSVPVRLSQIGVENNQENFNKIYQMVINGQFVQDDNEHHQRFSQALKAVM